MGTPKSPEGAPPPPSFGRSPPPFLIRSIGEENPAPISAPALQRGGGEPCEAWWRGQVRKGAHLGSYRVPQNPSEHLEKARYRLGLGRPSPCRPGPTSGVAPARKFGRNALTTLDSDAGAEPSGPQPPRNRIPISFLCRPPSLPPLREAAFQRANPAPVVLRASHEIRCNALKRLHCDSGLGRLRPVDPVQSRGTRRPVIPKASVVRPIARVQHASNDPRAPRCAAFGPAVT
jgi:hypothetical protein